MLCIRGTSHGPVSVCLSVCLCLSQVEVVLKRLNTGSHKQHHTLRPRDRCPRDTALAATPGTGQLQTGAYGIPSAERYGAIVGYQNRLVPVSNLPGCRRLRSSFTQQLLVPPYRLSTVGRRLFSVAASTFWDTLPNDIQSAPSPSSFRRQLKTFLFHQSFPDIIL